MTVFALPPMTTIRDVAEFRQHLQALLKEEEVVVDASRVDRIDTPALQLLIVFRDKALRLQKKFSWQPESSEAFLLALTTLGISEVLGFAKRE